MCGMFCKNTSFKIFAVVILPGWPPPPKKRGLLRKFNITLQSMNFHCGICLFGCLSFGKSMLYSPRLGLVTPDHGCRQLNQSLGATGPWSWLAVCNLGLRQLSPNLEAIFLNSMSYPRTADGPHPPIFLLV